MSNVEITEVPVIKPKIKIKKTVKRKLKEETQEEGQVIVHCVFKSGYKDCLIRIWKTTYLFSKNSTHKSTLLHIENVTMAPAWTVVEENTSRRFTLIFSPLPKGCKVFDLVEKIKDPFGFSFLNIKRNKTDVYNVEFS